MSKSFIADVGGTNIRLALVESGRITRIEKYLCKQFETILDAIEAFKLDCNVEQFEHACIAIACPVNDDIVKMTNHSWSFSKQELRDSLKLAALWVINDFTAVAHSLPTLSNDQVIQLGDGTKQEKGNIVVFGPGTGLGVEHLRFTSDGWSTLDGEGGHVDFAPNSEEDIIVWRYLKNKLGRVATEELLSGRGILNIYKALCEDKNVEPTLNEPSSVTQVGLNQADSLARKALNQFCRIMGSFAGNLAMNLYTTGGVYIGGGVVGHLGSFFYQSEFRQSFEAKGSMSNYVKNIPTYVINEPDHGLLGALAYLKTQLNRL